MGWDAHEEVGKGPVRAAVASFLQLQHGFQQLLRQLLAGALLGAAGVLPATAEAMKGFNKLGLSGDTPYLLQPSSVVNQRPLP